MRSGIARTPRTKRQFHIPVIFLLQTLYYSGNRERENADIGVDALLSWGKKKPVK